MTIREYIAANKLTQNAFARQCGLSHSALSLIISGKRRATTRQILAILSGSNNQVGFYEVCWDEPEVKALMRNKEAG